MKASKHKIASALVLAGAGLLPIANGWGQALPDKAAKAGKVGAVLVPSSNFPTIELAPGFEIEKVIGGLTYPTSVAWDSDGRLYVLEAGGSFVEEPPDPRILRVDNQGSRAIPVNVLTEIVNLSDKGVEDAAVGMAFFNGAFYITHRAPDRTGAVSRVTLDGRATTILSGIADSQSEHQVNDLRVRDGRMYLCVGPAANSAVVGIDLAPFVDRSPLVHTSVAQDIYLTGQNFETPNFTTPNPNDLAVTGAFVPFGTPTAPGQLIPKVRKPGGSILVFDPNNAEATLETYAWGLRNVIGIAWSPKGEMYAAVNGYDIRGSRPVKDEYDATYRVVRNTWYGWPDFSAALEPLTATLPDGTQKFDSPDSQQAPIVVDGVPQGKKLTFLIDHARSGLTPPDRTLVFGLHEWNSSPSLIDVAPTSWGDRAGGVFTAEWGDLAPPTNPLRDKPSGYQVTQIDPSTKQAVPFARNVKPGPASAQSATGQGLERPFGLRFGPDGALYLVDYGIARINPALAAQGKPPYEFPPSTGAIWKITRASARAATTQAGGR